MKTWKLVSGILSIIMFVFVTFQSCAAGISNSIEDNGEVGWKRRNHCCNYVIGRWNCINSHTKFKRQRRKYRCNRIIWIGRNHGIHNGWKLHRPYNLGSLVCNLCSISTYLNDKKAKTDRRKLIKTAI